MKKIFTILFLALTVGFMSCNDDNDRGTDMKNPKGTVLIQTEAGGLADIILAEDLEGETKLVIKGEMNFRDFITLQIYNKDLVYLNLLDVNIVAYAECEADVFYADYLKHPEKLNSANIFKKLNTVILPESLTTINDIVFRSLYELEKVVMSDNVTEMGNSVFKYCEKLTEVRLSKNINTIGTYSFYGCENLTTITMPDKLTSIGDSAFAETAIKKIIIPESVQIIGDLGYTNLEEIHLKNPIPCSIWYSNSGMEKITIYVPKGSKAAYEAHEVWGQAKEIIEE